MQFNVEAAKKAGYTDAEIADFRSQFDAATKAGYTPDEIDRFLADQSPQAPVPNPAFEREAVKLLRKPGGAQAAQNLAEKYGMQIANPNEIAMFQRRYGGSPEAFAYKASPEAIPTLPTVEDDSFDLGNLARSVAKGATFNFADEVEAALRAPFSDKSYYDIKSEINAAYDKWAKDNWKQALAGEMLGGVATLAVPGVGALGATAKGAEAAGAVRNAANLAKMGAKYGTGYGAIGGAGASENMNDIVPSTILGGIEGALAGAVASPALSYAGKGVKALYGKVAGRQAPAVDRAEQAAGAQIIRAVNRESSVPEIEAAALLREKYGVPMALGDLSPELQKLQTKVARTPSEGQTALLEDVSATMRGAPERTKEQLHKAFPDADDYFRTEDVVADRLRKTYDTLGETALNAGQVRDKSIMKLIHNPVMSRYFLKAKQLADTNAAAAEARGEDPAKYLLKMELEPVLDAQGALIGLAPTGRTIPDVRALDYLRRAMSDDIDAGFSGTSSAGKSVASGIKDLRNALVSRMDATIPAYRDYRAAYAGDKQVQDALRLGRDMFTRQRPQEVSALFKKPQSKGGFSAAERQAYAAGVMQHLLQPIENPSQLRNFADNIIGSEATREKLKTVLPKAQYDVLEQSLKLEAENFKSNAKAIAGNPEMARISQEIEQTMADEGVSPHALITLLQNSASPTSWARFGVHLTGLWNKLPHRQARDKMFTAMAQALREKDTGKIVDLLNSAESQEAARIAAASAQQRRAAVTGAVAGDLAEQTMREPTPSAPAIEIAPKSDEGLANSVGIDVSFGGDVYGTDAGGFSDANGNPLSREEAKALFRAAKGLPDDTLFDKLYGTGP